MPSRPAPVAPWPTPTEPGHSKREAVKVNSDTSWLGIFDRTPSGRPDFAHTKPFTAAPAEDLALLFGAFGVQTLRASLVEVGSMHCTHAWHITEAGGMVEAPGDGDVDSAFASAMATIIHLNPAGTEQTLTRKLDPQCWAFAWPVDQHHVAVVEAHYRLTRSDQGDADAALVRHVCDAGMRVRPGPLRRPMSTTTTTYGLRPARSSGWCRRQADRRTQRSPLSQRSQRSLPACRTRRLRRRPAAACVFQHG